MTLDFSPGNRLRGALSGQKYRLGHFIAGGGEGRVFAIDEHPDLVAKLYSRKMERDKAKKLVAMIKANQPQIQSIAAWPMDVLTAGFRKPVGLVMPRIANAVPLHLLINPMTRLKTMPQLTYGSLLSVATNVARAVATLHRAGIVIGDINGQNFLVMDNGTVRAIDCDSMQMLAHSNAVSGVGVEEYLAPELQGRNLRHATRTPNQDNFALAALIFELLVMGRHPFSGNGNLALGDAIKTHRHAFDQSPPPHNAFAVTRLQQADLLDNGLIDLFDKAFSRHGVVHGRPKAIEWCNALYVAYNNLRRCPANAGHDLPSSARQCPWCAMEKRNLPPLFRAMGMPATTSVPVFKRPKTRTPFWAEVKKLAWPVTVLVAETIGRFVYGVLSFMAETLWEIIEPILEMLLATIISMLELVGSILGWFLKWIIRTLSVVIGMMLGGLAVVIVVSILLQLLGQN